VLTSNGFAYDSSTLGPPGHTSVRGEMRLFPVTTVAYRRKDARLKPYPAHVTPRALLREFPLGTAVMLSHCRPLYGALLGYYGRRRRPCTFYVHPWQLAPALLPPRFRSLHPLRMLNRFSLFPTLRKLLKRHSFRRMDWLLTAAPEAIREQPVHFMTVDLW
jgi:hypothetical protein